MSQDKYKYKSNPKNQFVPGNKAAAKPGTSLRCSLNKPLSGMIREKVRATLNLEREPSDSECWGELKKVLTDWCLD